ncbi:MAG: response regulator [Planctomycetes bacterium]|nr:response regulator [Planctomycetota bacterium]
MPDPAMDPERPVPPPVRPASHEKMDLQIERDAGLARRLATIEAEIAVLGGCARALELGISLSDSLSEILRRGLGAAGFSSGAVYLWSEGKVLTLAGEFGFEDAAASGGARDLEIFPLLAEAARGGRIVQVDSDEVAEHTSLLPLARFGLTSLLLSPLNHAGENVGLVLMGTGVSAPAEDWHPFARAMSAQLAQAVVLSRDHTRLLESEERYRRLAEAAGKSEEALRVSMNSEVSLQEQLRQSQKMEAIGQLAGGVAHDFNNLLTVILGHSDLLLRRLKEGDPAHRGTLEIRKAAVQAAALTQQLLAFSRRQVLQPRILDLNAVLSDMESMLRRLIAEDVDLVTILSPRLGRVMADPGQVQQVILNLAVNARDAMPRGGRLTLETSDAALDEEYARAHPGASPGEYVMLAVSDTGTGMDEATRARIFEPFFTTKEQGRGTGLGLATVYGVVKQTGGTIWVYSEPGKGSTFKIYLPRLLAEGDPGPAAPEASRVDPRGSETVLLVEDSGPVRQFAREALVELGYRVIEAPDGAAALVRAESSGPIHLLLTDVVMPGMSGRELADRLVALRPGVRVLYTSGYTDRTIVSQGVLDPGMAFIQKPYTPDLLGRKIREVLDAPAGR